MSTGGFERLEATVKAIRDQITAVRHARAYTVDQVMREVNNIEVSIYRGGTPSDAQQIIIERKKAEIKAEAMAMAIRMRDSQITNAVDKLRALRVTLVQECVAASHDTAIIALALEAPQ